RRPRIVLCVKVLPLLVLLGRRSVQVGAVRVQDVHAEVVQQREPRAVGGPPQPADQPRLPSQPLPPMAVGSDHVHGHAAAVVVLADVRNRVARDVRPAAASAACQDDRAGRQREDSAGPPHRGCAWRKTLCAPAAAFRPSSTVVSVRIAKNVPVWNVPAAGPERPHVIAFPPDCADTAQTRCVPETRITVSVPATMLRAEAAWAGAACPAEAGWRRRRTTLL